MPERSADDIQRDIERARVELASAVDQLAYRTNPHRVVEKAKRGLVEKARTPQGQVVIAAVGGLIGVAIYFRFRKR